MSSSYSTVFWFSLYKNSEYSAFRGSNFLDFYINWNIKIFILFLFIEHPKLLKSYKKLFDAFLDANGRRQFGKLKSFNNTLFCRMKGKQNKTPKSSLKPHVYWDTLHLSKIVLFDGPLNIKYRVTHKDETLKTTRNSKYTNLKIFCYTSSLGYYGLLNNTKIV